MHYHDHLQSEDCTPINDAQSVTSVTLYQVDKVALSLSFTDSFSKYLSSSSKVDREVDNETANVIESYADFHFNFFAKTSAVWSVMASRLEMNSISPVLTEL